MRLRKKKAFLKHKISLNKHLRKLKTERTHFIAGAIKKCIKIDRRDCTLIFKPDGEKNFWFVNQLWYPLFQITESSQDHVIKYAPALFVSIQRLSEKNALYTHKNLSPDERDKYRAVKLVSIFDHEKFVGIRTISLEILRG